MMFVDVLRSDTEDLVSFIVTSMALSGNPEKCRGMLASLDICGVSYAFDEMVYRCIIRDVGTRVYQRSTQGKAIGGSFAYHA